MSWAGTREELYAANLWLRTASRVLVRVASFRAKAFYELERRANKVPWERFVGPGQRVRFRVTCRKSRLYHSDAVAQRLAAAIERRVGGGGATVWSGKAEGAVEVDAEDETAPSDAQLFVVRFLHDECTISADASGALLHLRGYRQAVGKAPLRETIAAAMLLASGWDSRVALVDPMCGSGTIPIEGALLARRIAPGLARDFAFTHWPDFDRALWDRLLDEARARILPSPPAPIAGFDHAAAAVAAAMSNAERAGVAGDVRLETREVSAFAPPAGEPGWVVTNPPYGLRVGEAAELGRLYAGLGRVVRERAPGWRLAMLSPDPRLEAAAGVELREVFQTSNGGVPVRLVTATA